MLPSFSFKPHGHCPVSSRSVRRTPAVGHRAQGRCAGPRFRGIVSSSIASARGTRTGTSCPLPFALGRPPCPPGARAGRRHPRRPSERTRLCPTLWPPVLPFRSPASRPSVLSVWAQRGGFTKKEEMRKGEMVNSATGLPSVVRTHPRTGNGPRPAQPRALSPSRSLHEPYPVPPPVAAGLFRFGFIFFSRSPGACSRSLSHRLLWQRGGSFRLSAGGSGAKGPGSPLRTK